MGILGQFGIENYAWKVLKISGNQKKFSSDLEHFDIQQMKISNIEKLLQKLMWKKLLA